MLNSFIMIYLFPQVSYSLPPRRLLLNGSSSTDPPQRILLDQDEDDGCFLCWPGSHREHPSITKDIWRGRSDWVPLTNTEVDALKDKGYAPRRVR